MAYAFNEDKTKARILTATKTISSIMPDNYNSVIFTPSDFGVEEIPASVMILGVMQSTTASDLRTTPQFASNRSGTNRIYPYAEIATVYQGRVGQIRGYAFNSTSDTRSIDISVTIMF